MPVFLIVHVPRSIPSFTSSPSLKTVICLNSYPPLPVSPPQPDLLKISENFLFSLSDSVMKAQGGDAAI